MSAAAAAKNISMDSSTECVEDNEETGELEELERQLRQIERQAHKLARREFWVGFGAMIMATLCLIIMTWLLSWNVMEPICYFLTLLNYFVGFGFFMITSKQPSFNAFYTVRFKANCDRLIRSRGFDALRLQQLRGNLQEEEENRINRTTNLPLSDC